jgi:hypothetical protein
MYAVTEVGSETGIEEYYHTEQFSDNFGNE